VSDCDEFYDMIADIRKYQSESDELITLMMDTAKIMGQHHIKIDFALSDGDMEGGALPVFSPYMNTHRSGLYAFSIDRSKTVYVGSNQDYSNNTVYNRVIRFGRAINDREYSSEYHTAGRKYRTLYGNDTSKLYLSFLFYDQFTDHMIRMMRELRLNFSDIEKLLIRRFSSRYLLNVMNR
jgi:hypothetical protein